METTDDILREMRALGKLDKKSTDKIPRSLLALGLLAYADRIEAAVKRMGEVRYQIQEPCKGMWANVFSTKRSKRTAKLCAESSSKAAKNLGQNPQRRIVKIIQTEEVVWELE